MKPPIFENLRLSNIRALIEVLTTSGVSGRARIEKLYSERAQYLDETLEFLSSLDIARDANATIGLRNAFSSIGGHDCHKYVMQQLFTTKSRYRSEAREFLSLFKVVSGEITYMSSPQFRSAESDVRNFLIDMEIVHPVEGSEKYTLAPEYVSLYIAARDNMRVVSPAALKRNMDAKSATGLAAEKVIVEYERNRLGPTHMAIVDHVAKRNSSAGYDIRSVSIGANGEMDPRFIEVKAVPADSLRFFWSRNELKVAQALAGWYHLYLLPVDRDREFNVEALTVIADPCSVVLQKESGWITESDTIMCQLSGRSNKD